MMLPQFLSSKQTMLIEKNHFYQHEQFILVGLLRMTMSINTNIFFFIDKSKYIKGQRPQSIQGVYKSA